MLTACCGGNNGRSDFDVKFDLLMNPDTCNQLDYSNSLHDSPAPCTGLGCEWLPLSLVEGGITPHCPGCITPGIVVSSYRMERKTFGLQDSDNNGKADNGALTITQNSTWYDANKSKLKLNNSQFGDLVEDYLVAYFSPGEAGSGGYNYDQMLADSVQLPYLQLSRTISAALDTMNLIPDSMYIYIDSPADSIRLDSCNDCALFNVNPLKFETQLELHIDAAHLQDFLKLDYTNNSYLYTLVSADTLGILSGNLHNTFPYYKSTSFPFIGYFEKQQYRIRVFYSTLGNFKVPAAIINLAIKDVQKKSEIKNKMWLTQSPKVANAFSIYPAQPSSLASLQNDYQYTIYPDSISLLPHIDSAFIDSFLFICESFDGLHYFYSEDGRNQSNVSFTDSCNRLINVQALIRTAGDLLDIYPYEYKTSALRFNKYIVNVPPNFELVSISASNSVNYNSSKKFSKEILLGSNQFVKNQNQYIVYDSTLIQKSCLEEIDNPLNDTMFYGDSSTFRILKFNIKPISCDSTFFGNPDSLVEVFFNTRNKLCNPVVGLAANFQDSIMQDGDTTTVFKLENNLQIQPPLIPLIANSNQLCFDVVFTNPVNPSLTYSGGVPYLYLAIKKDAVSDLFSNWTAQINGGSTFAFNNLLVEVDSLLSPNGIDSLTICVNFNTCLDSNLIDFTPLQFYSGWNCSNFPDSPFSVDSVCNFKLDTVRIQPSQTAMAANITEPEEYSLCEADTIFATFSSLKDGLIYPKAISLSSIQQGVTINSVNIGNPDSSVFIPISYNSTFQNYTISGADLVSIGYVDSSFNDTIDFSIAIIVTPTCSFNSSNFLDFNLTALNYCGDTVKYTANRRVTSLSWSGLSFCDTCFSISKTASTDTVNINSTIAYTITITSNNANSSLVMLNELFPSGFTLVSQTPPPTFAPNIYAVPAQGAISIVISGYFSNPAICDSNINFVAIKHVAPDSALFTAQACVEVVEPCIDNNTIVFPDKYAISALVATLPSSYLKNKKCYIAGELNIDMDFKFEDCKLIMAPGSVINILRDADLTLDSTSVVGCDSMWQGIFLEASSSIFVLRSSCINDADIAIKGNDGTNIICLNSSLENNVTGILYPKISTSNVFNSGVLNVGGCKFGLTTAFKPDYLTQTPHGNYPFAGIILNDFAATIGKAGTLPNVFRQLNNGILSYRSSVVVSNSLFSLIKRDPFYTTKNNGCAIVSNGEFSSSKPGYLKVNTTLGTVVIDSCAFGISTNYSTLEVANITINQVWNAIQSNRCTNLLYTSVNGCTINAKKYGIKWNNCDGAKYMKAIGNTITVTNNDTATTGIYCGEAMPGGGYGNYEVTNNLISVINNGMAISMLNCKKPLINYNYINLINPNDSLIGINLNGLNSGDINCNIIVGDTSLISLTTSGIKATLSNDLTLSCNNLKSVGTGFYFGGTCGGTVYQGNLMEKNYQGLYLNITAAIGSQIQSGNKWVNYFNPFGAYNANSLNIGLSRFEVNTLPGTIFYPNLDLGSNSGWFVTEPGLPYNCQSNSTCTPFAATNTDITYERAISQDAIQMIIYSDETKYQSDEYLYGYLQNNPNAINYDYDFQTFFNQHQNTAIGDLYNIERDLILAGTFLPSTINLVLITDSLLNLYVDSIANIDSYGFGNNEIALDRIQLSITNLQQTRIAIFSQQNNTAETYFNHAKNINDNLIVSEIPAINARTMNDLYFENITNDTTFFESNYSTLMNIANQCPYSGGVAVYQARNKLMEYNDTLTFNDDAICLQEGIFRFSTSKNILPIIAIAPNPATTQFKISIISNDHLTGSIALMNTLGETVLTTIFDSDAKSNTIDVDKLASGVYLAKLISQSGFILIKKLIIVR